MKIQHLNTQSELFMKNLINCLAPHITERLSKGETDIMYTENELKEILEVYDWTTSNLYVRLKNDLLNFEIGVSIKRIPNASKFTFFKRTENVTKIIDTFKTEFDKYFKPGLINYLNKPENKMIGIPEDWIKKKLNYENYSTNYLYSRLKKVLENTGINVILTRKVLIKEDIMNIYTFYYEKTEQIDTKDLIIENKELDEDEEEFKKYLIESKEKEIKDVIPIEYNNTIIICPLCKKGEIKYPETICPFCNEKVIKKWE